MSLTEGNAAAENECDDENRDRGIEVIALFECEEVDGEARENGTDRAQCIAQ